MRYMAFIYWTLLRKTDIRANEASISKLMNCRSSFNATVKRHGGKNLKVVLQVAAKGVEERILLNRVVAVFGILISDWIKLRRSHAIYGDYVTC